MTWSWNRDIDYFWPFKYLPCEPDIKEARISTFGYSANFRRGSAKNKMAILDFAKELLFGLRYGQDESASEMEDLGMGQRPIIFVVHSMGGLIVKEAYMQGQNDPEYEDIIQSIVSIMFLSTPHRGANLAKTLNRILKVSFVANPMQYIAELASGSQTLQKLNEGFRHVAPRMQIVSFYETRPTTIFKQTQMMVLEKDSSVLGYPGEISVPLDADHHGVCKYAGPDDPRYIIVRNVLKSVVGKTKRRGKLEPEPEPEVLQAPPRYAPQASPEEYLSVPEAFDEDFQFFRNRWTPGTCSWFLNHESFTSWVHDTHLKPRVLWVHGNAASGKSILSTSAIEHLNGLDLHCQFFFIRFIDRKKRTLSLMLRSLACQLARCDPDYLEVLRRLESAATDLKSADFRSIWQTLYKQGLFQLNYTMPLYWIIDGVDEADSPGSLIKLLADLYLTELPLRVMIVSRKTHEISSAFQKLGKVVHVESVRTEGNRDDLSAYIDQEMDIPGDDLYREEVGRQLLSRSRGNFLWVHLAVHQINKCQTKPAVAASLEELPPGMEALYDRMAQAVQNQASPQDMRLGRRILGWATCAQRPLGVEELNDALGDDNVLDIHRTIGDLCGGFVVVDQEGKVAMIHETARSYLTRRDFDDALVVDQLGANEMIFKRCMQCLMDSKLRGQLNRNQPPALLDYAASAWAAHFSLAFAEPEVMDVISKFLRGPYVLTWIQIAAHQKYLKALVIASRYLSDVVFKLRRMDEGGYQAHQAKDVIEGWATDLVKLVGKFGNSLLQNPDAIHKLIPPFCPEASIIYQHFGRREAKSLSVSGASSTLWGDCLARLPQDQGVVASVVLAAGSRIAILTTIKRTSQIVIYKASTFEELLRITHPERVFTIACNRLGELLVSYGYTTTKIWNSVTGECIKTVANPARRPRPQTILFIENDNTLLIGHEDSCIRSLSLAAGAKYELRSQIDEESLGDTTINQPTCSALSPDGSMIALGYRGHPLTVWETDPPMLVGQFNMTIDSSLVTIHEKTWGEVTKLAWHPLTGEVFGLTVVGLLFKWDPYEAEPSLTSKTGGNIIAVNGDGSLIAIGDVVGNMKIYTAADFSLIYHLSSSDQVLFLSFSTDSARLYEVSGSYGSIWEPNVLVRLADSSEYSDHDSDALSETESLAKPFSHVEHNSASSDNVIAISGQTVGPLYCYGTDSGIAVLGEAGRGKVCDLERGTNYFSIEQVAWSEDGRLVAISDLTGRLMVKRVIKDNQERNHWQVSQKVSLVIPSREGSACQLLFHPSADQLFVFTHTTIYSVDLASRQLNKAPFSEDPAKIKWVFHPLLSGCLLGFGSTHVRVFDSSDLRQLHEFAYIPPAQASSTSPPSSVLQQMQTARREHAMPGRLICSVESPCILLQLILTVSSGQLTSEYLIFKAEDIKLSGRSREGTHLDELPYASIPAELACRIHVPLGFLSRGRLVFLDVDRWISTWRMLPSAAPQPRRPSGSDATLPGVERYYILPGDWVTSNLSHLYTLMPDGTLLCPLDGEVATVQSSKLR